MQALEKEVNDLHALTEKKERKLAKLRSDLESRETQESESFVQKKFLQAVLVESHRDGVSLTKGVAHLKDAIVPDRLYGEAVATCFHCKKSFDDPASLDVHVREHFKKKTPTKCFAPECNAHLLNLDRLAAHVIAVHCNIPSTCSVCGDTNEAHYCAVGPASLVGQRISVRFFTDNGPVWYAGHVLCYDEKRRAHDVFYEADSVQRTETLHTCFWRILQQTPSIGLD